MILPLLQADDEALHLLTLSLLSLIAFQYTPIHTGNTQVTLLHTTTMADSSSSKPSTSSAAPTAPPTKPADFQSQLTDEEIVQPIPDLQRGLLAHLHLDSSTVFHTDILYAPTVLACLYFQSHNTASFYRNLN